jgi:hypothetical protein
MLDGYVAIVFVGKRHVILAQLVLGWTWDGAT